jgi:hypothetical protein
MSETSFPSYFPSGCPPPEASAALGHVYRIVAGNVLTDSDFKSHFEAGTALNAPPCRRCGVSVFHSLERAQHRLRLSPHIGNAIAQGELKECAGKTQLTSERSGHLEWWPFDGVLRRSYFSEPTP